MPSLVFCVAMGIGFWATPAKAQELIFQETFETDGEGTRYTTQGSSVYETARIINELNRNDQIGPVYWARKSKVSVVGLPELTPARRALMCWHHTIDPTLVTPEFLSLFDSVVSWLMKNKTSGTVLFSPPPSGSGDTVLIDRLISKGFRIVDDNGAVLPVQPAVDLIISSSNGTAGEGPSRFALYPVPMLTYNAASHDDELLSTSGESGVRFPLADISIVATNHPAAGGKKGLYKAVTGEAQYDTIGRLLPSGAVVLASFQRTNTADPKISETVPFIVLIEEGASGGKCFSGGPFVGFEGKDFFAGAGLNKFATDIDPKSLTFKPIDVTGKKNLKLTIAVAATFLDFEPSDYLDVLVDPDGDGPAPFTQLIEFTAPSDDDRFLSDAGTTQKTPANLGLQFQDVTYDLPADATKLIVRIEAMNNWWNEIIGFDNIRITAGETAVKPTIAVRRDSNGSSIDFIGILQTAISATGPWTNVANAKSPYTIDRALGATQFFRTRSP